jgi:hypothetical protein
LRPGRKNATTKPRQYHRCNAKLDTARARRGIAHDHLFYQVRSAYETIFSNYFSIAIDINAAHLELLSLTIQAPHRHKLNVMKQNFVEDMTNLMGYHTVVLITQATLSYFEANHREKMPFAHRDADRSNCPSSSRELCWPARNQKASTKEPRLGT